MGYASLYNNSTGILKCANGYFSLFNNTTGSGNIGIGYNTLNTLTTGGNNTAIGYQGWCSAESHKFNCYWEYGYSNASNQIRLGNAAITSLYCAAVQMHNYFNCANLYIDPASGQIMRSTSAVGGTYCCGTGITLTLNTFSHTAHTGDATGATSLTVIGIQGVGVSAATPVNTQVLRYNGTNWIPSNETAYAAGLGYNSHRNYIFSHCTYRRCYRSYCTYRGCYTRCWCFCYRSFEYPGSQIQWYKLDTRFWW